MDGFFSSDDFYTPEQSKPLPPRLLGSFPPPKAVKVKDVKLEDIPQVVMDIEGYVNYFLIRFMRLSDRKVFVFEQTDYHPLDSNGVHSVVGHYELITFKGFSFDIPILRLALTGASCATLKEAANRLIKGNLTPWAFSKEYNLPEIEIDFIDLAEVAPGVAISLKLYGGRHNCEKLIDLPIPEDSVLTEKDMDLINDEYCQNDLDLTADLFMQLLPQIQLRRVLSARYGTDLRSKSDAQIAEAVITSELRKLTRKPLQKRAVEEGSFVYRVPDFITFTDEYLKGVLRMVTSSPFIIQKTGTLSMPKELSNLKVKIGSSVYRMGIGGLHSSEKTAFHISDGDYTLYDWDVNSYYPSIILNCSLYPRQLGREFLKVYAEIVEERLEAKKSGDKTKADSLKITVNGSFGKLGSPYSLLYAPELMIQVTVTGQLSLLMLINMLEDEGISVVSGNTDGVVIKCPNDKKSLMEEVIHEWEHRTGFEMEQSVYAGIYSRDVNNYIAIKPDGSVKTKGCFSPAGLNKNPENEICALAMVDFLKYGTPIEDSIRNCRDITKFLTVRKVNGGAIKDGRYLGKVIRWYHSSKETGCIQYQNNNNKVPQTEKAQPLMTLTSDFPDDVDYLYYIDKAKGIFY